MHVTIYRDRIHAGQLLASALVKSGIIDKDRAHDPLVFGLSRGGVPVAYEVAAALSLPLDVLVVRKLGVPGQEELAMGAIAPGGVSVRNEIVISEMEVSPREFEEVKARERHELERREKLYRAGRAYPYLGRRTVILVDDGLATGSTMRAALTWAARQHPAEIVVAVPVGAAVTCDELEGEYPGVHCICRDRPAEFGAVGAWYADFTQVPDMEVLELMTAAASHDVERAHR